MVSQFRGKEGLSQLSTFSVVVLCDDPELDLASMLWHSARIALFDDDGHGDPRYFWGIVERASYLGQRGGRSQYRFDLETRLHGLSYKSRSKIFQGHDVTEIVREVLKDSKITESRSDWKTKAVYPKREYCVQYQESDLNFVLRLFEDEGIFFWFAYDEHGEKVVIGDNPGVHESIAEPTALPFDTTRHDDREGVGDLVFSSSVLPDSHHARDWNWQSPDAPVDVGQSTKAGAGLEWYEYPGGFQDGYDGQRRSQHRLEALSLRRFQISGSSTSRRLAPGLRFEVVDAEPDYLSQEVLLLEVEHVFAEHLEAQGQSAQAARYECSFVSVPAGTPFRPERKTPKPKVTGKETAIVTGPKGEEIVVDDEGFGRVKVLFYWDREGRADGSATCWIRVQQQNTSGSLVIPRIGWEVDVGFINGDPDHPIVMQKLYNWDTLPPYALPASDSMASLQSSTSPGGGSVNEMVTNDTAGKMNFGFNASRDLIVEVGADMTETVTVDAKEKVGLDLTTAVTVNETITVGANQKLTVVANRMEEVVGSRTISVGAMDDFGSGKNSSFLVDGSRSETIGAAMNAVANEVTENYQAGYTRTVGAAQMIQSAGAHMESVTGNKTELVGGLKMEVVRGGKEEQVTGSKVLTAGLIKRKVKGDLSMKGKAGLIITVGGPVVEKIGENYTLGAKTISVTVGGKASLKGGGSSLSMTPGGVKAKGAKMGPTGMALLKLKGNIEYK